MRTSTNDFSLIACLLPSFLGGRGGGSRWLAAGDPNVRDLLRKNTGGGGVSEGLQEHAGVVLTKGEARPAGLTVRTTQRLGHTSANAPLQ